MAADKPRPLLQNSLDKHVMSEPAETDLRAMSVQNICPRLMIF